MDRANNFIGSALTWLWPTSTSNNQVQNEQNQVQVGQRNKEEDKWGENELVVHLEKYVQDPFVFEDFLVLERLGFSPQNKLSVQVDKTEGVTSKQLVISQTNASTYIGSNLQALGRSISHLNVYSSIHADGKSVLERVNEVMEAVMPWNLIDVRQLSLSEGIEVYKDLLDFLKSVKGGMTALTEQYETKYPSQEKTTRYSYATAQVFCEMRMHIESMKLLQEDVRNLLASSSDYPARERRFKELKSKQSEINKKIEELITTSRQMLVNMSNEQIMFANALMVDAQGESVFTTQRLGQASRLFN
jgi:hypothetical protein